MPPPGEPRESPKPQPIGSYPLVSLFTLATLCALFIIWRRANSLRTVVAHQLKTWSGNEGRIRLSEDDGPPAHSFVRDDDDDLEDLEPLAARAERIRKSRDLIRATTPPAPAPPPQDPISSGPSFGDPLLS